MRMPGQSYRDTPPPLEGEHELEERLLADVERLVLRQLSSEPTEGNLLSYV